MKPQLKEQFKKMEIFVNNANEIAQDINIEKLTNDIPYQYSLLYPLGQIGELAIYMSRHKEIEESFPEIEWSKWRGFRNRLFHDYNMLDFTLVLEMITDALPLLQRELRKILETHSVI